MLIEGLQKTNKTIPLAASGHKQIPITKFVLVPSGLGLREDERLPGGSLNREHVIQKYSTRCRRAAYPARRTSSNFPSQHQPDVRHRRQCPCPIRTP
jgi:hypothetical protein